MSPAHLRGMVGVDLADMASRLGLTVPALRALEAAPVITWRALELVSYLSELGYSLKLVAVRERDGARVEVGP